MMRGQVQVGAKVGEPSLKTPENSLDLLYCMDHSWYHLAQVGFQDQEGFGPQNRANIRWVCQLGLAVDGEFVAPGVAISCPCD